ncbi:MAG: flavoprotein [Cuniculiplasma sp.]
MENNHGKLPCKTMILGITGSVMAANMTFYLNMLKNKFAENVYVIMTKASENFLSPYAMELISGHKVFRNLFDNFEGISVPHIQLSEKADIFLIMPATANIIGKAAGGICDDLISTSVIGSKCKVVFVPSMNERMWYNKAVQSNVKKLKGFNYNIVEPGYGTAISNSKISYGAVPPFDLLLKHLLEILKDPS